MQDLYTSHDQSGSAAVDECSTSPTTRREEQLVEGHPLKRVQRCLAGVYWECLVQEAEPPVLQRRHDEGIRHEPDHALELERRRSLTEARVFGPGDSLAVNQIMNLDREEIVFTSHRGFRVGLSLLLADAEGCEGLCYRICDAAEDLRARVYQRCTSVWWVLKGGKRTAFVIMVVRMGRLA